MRILITGGAGFIGSATVREAIRQGHEVLVLDCLTYAGNLDSLAPVSSSEAFTFSKTDIRESPAVKEAFAKYRPEAVLHLAAESHVDRSIEGPRAFLDTNVTGTYVLLEAAQAYWEQLDDASRGKFRFHHISTDEVFGDLAAEDPPFTENSSYAPSSPYAATKAASDHLVRAWARTYGLPTIITNCSNNYGPYHFPEKLIPHMILNALHGKALPVYGDGLQIRDWLYVEDHARALLTVLAEGEVNETYAIGGRNEVRNIDVVHAICNLLDELAPNRKTSSSYKDLITFVKDRPGHDRRYAIDASKIERELGWKPAESFESGLRKTVIWFLENEAWWTRVLSGEYRLERLGARGIDQ